MKTGRCFILTLLILVTLTFVPNNFAQDTAFEYVVRVVYFYPNDRQLHPDIDTILDTQMKKVQSFFADEMERHGFGRKTFRFETDDDGNIVLHYVKSKSNLSRFATLTSNTSVSDVTLNIRSEIRRQGFEESNNIDLIIADLGSGAGGTFAPDSRGHGTASAVTRNFADMDQSDFHLILHELGHGFGLEHDWRSDDYIMSYGGRIRSVLSSCAAEWLDVSKYFNPTYRTINNNTDIKMLAPKLTTATAPATIQFHFEITDPDGLHQAQLFLRQEYENSDWTTFLYDCKSLNGSTTITTEFLLTTEFLFNDPHALDSKEIFLRVIDLQGNFNGMGMVFPVDFTHLLTEPVSIPDSSLEKAVRKTLGLKANSPITQMDMLKLRDINILPETTNITSSTAIVIPDNQKITNIKGLEHAKLLRTISISDNMISDITPLANLTNLYLIELRGNRIRKIPSLTGLTRLRQLLLHGNQIKDITQLAALTNLANFDYLVLSNNQISDITSLTGLTRLRYLFLDGNQIKDIKPLAALTNLTVLHLPNNQIRDVTPLENLVNLRHLGLVNNQIKNRKPLLALLRKNPDIEIWLKSGDKPLPVNLSHFRAELTDTGVILKWTTESEVDNAGFYIYRSQTRDGAFKVVNPTLIQGAGTTSERNTYTWKDTTAKPNIVYYYRIEDISHVGERKQLATVRMRGLVSAKGKLTTSWADLKTQN